MYFNFTDVAVALLILCLLIFFLCFQDHSLLKRETVVMKSIHNDRYGTPVPYVAVCGKHLKNLCCSHDIRNYRYHSDRL